MNLQVGLRLPTPACGGAGMEGGSRWNCELGSLFSGERLLPGMVVWGWFVDLTVDEAACEALRPVLHSIPGMLIPYRQAQNNAARSRSVWRDSRRAAYRAWLQ